MNAPAVIREKAPHMNQKSVDDYLDKVWKLLKAMKPGDCLIIDNLCKPETRELFIECCKFYMREHNSTYQDGLTFSKGFVAIQKYDLSFTSGKSGKRQPEKSVFNNTINTKQQNLSQQWKN